MSVADKDRLGPDGASTASTAALPGALTSRACSAFRDIEEEFRDGLRAELRRRRRSPADLTADDVYAARTIVARGMCPVRKRDGSWGALGSGLIAIGSVGVGSMHPYLHSPWQVALLVAFVVVGVAGVGLTWWGKNWTQSPVDSDR